MIAGVLKYYFFLSFLNTHIEPMDDSQITFLGSILITQQTRLTNSWIFRHGVPTFRYTQRQRADDPSRPLFEHDMRVYQCSFPDCTKVDYITFPYCKQHSSVVHGVGVGRSTIVGAGDGLFATTDLHVGHTIPYTGELISQSQLDNRYGFDDTTTAPYAYRLDGTNLYIDSALMRCAAAMANHNPDNVNAELITIHDGAGGANAFLRVIRNIDMGDEIFIDYGDEYQFHNGKSETLFIHEI